MEKQIKTKIKKYIYKNFYKGDLSDNVNLFETGILTHLLCWNYYILEKNLTLIQNLVLVNLIIKSISIHMKKQIKKYKPKY